MTSGFAVNRTAPHPRVGGAFPPTVAAGRPAAVRAGGVVRAHLPRGARAAVHLGAVERRLVHRQPRPQLDARQLRNALQSLRLPDDRAAHDRDRGGRDRHRRDPGAAVRLLRRADRPQAAAERPVRGGADPAVVELPRARVRVAADPRQRRDPQLGPRQRRPRLAEHRLLQLGDVDRVQLHLAAVHDPAGVVGDRAGARLLHRGLGRPRRARLADVPHGPACR